MEKLRGEANTWLYRALDEILYYIWDPIGVAGVSGARSEYQAYVPELFRLLNEGKDEQAIAAHLGRVAMQRMGLPPNIARDHEAARAAVGWREVVSALSEVPAPEL